MTPDAVIAALAEVVAQGALDVRAKVGIRVHADDASFDWVLDLNRKGGGWLCDEEATAAFDDTHVRIFAFADAFADLVLAPDRLTGHLSSGEIVVEGDRAVLTRMAQLMEAPRTALSARLALREPAAAPR